MKEDEVSFEKRFKRNPKYDLDVEDAIKFVKSKNTKFVWLGNEPVKEVSEILNIESDTIKKLDPEAIIYSDKEELKDLENSVLICYHGNTSGFLSEFLNRRHGLEVYGLKGGLENVVAGGD
ncbi:MAG: hypothetical protein M1559_02850 [Candidatus Marsarchaeota archaeon]|jgi:rhodanese-related sulfurtransferase|nr:hypothetical protein [Candidatus Marsarchaeota archaeon]